MSLTERIDLDETLEMEEAIDDDDDGESDDEDLELSRISPPLLFLVLKDEFGIERRIPLKSGQNRIGRDPNLCHVVIPSPTASKLHAVIEVKVSNKLPSKYKDCQTFVDMLS